MVGLLYPVRVLSESFCAKHGGYRVYRARVNSQGKVRTIISPLSMGEEKPSATE